MEAVLETHRKPLPKLDLNVTNKCNLRCKHCAFTSGEWNINEMSVDELERILRETKKLGGRRIDITGGEPTARKDLLEIIRRASELEYSIELVTNGVTLNKEKLVALKDAGLDAIAVSLDGSNYETHRRLRNVTQQQYARTKQTIEDALEVGLRTKINTVVHMNNIYDIKNIMRYACALDVAEHGIYYFTEVGRGSSSGIISVPPLFWIDYVQKKLKWHTKKLNYTLETPLLQKEIVDRLGVETGCVADSGQNHLQILPDGLTYPCAIMAAYEKPVADLRTSGLETIWDKKQHWQTYWKEITPLFDDWCVDLGSVPEGYVPVCPLRKFKLEEVMP